MESNTLSITYKKREKLTKADKYLKIFFGLFWIAFGIIQLIRVDYKPVLFILFIITGLSHLAFAFWGKQLYLTRSSLEINDNKLIVKNNPDRRDIINLKSIKQISFLSSGLKVLFEDSVKFINLSWMTSDQIQMLKDKIVGIGKLNKFDVN